MAGIAERPYYAHRHLLRPVRADCGRDGGACGHRVALEDSRSSAQPEIDRTGVADRQFATRYHDEGAAAVIARSVATMQAPPWSPN